MSQNAYRSLSGFVAAGLLALAPLSVAQEGAVYTMSNATNGNAVLVFQRDAAGLLSSPATVATGGIGTGASLGNQGAVILTDDERWLLAVNPGDDTISVFSVRSDGLELVETAKSGGVKPVSVTVHGSLAAVLHAGGDSGDKDSVTTLSLDEDGQLKLQQHPRILSAPSTSPAQVAFVQDGRVLVVTEKSTNLIDTFVVRRNGNLGTVTSHGSAGQQPFGFASGKRDQVFVSEATSGSVSSYEVSQAGELTVLDSAVTTNQQAACWVVVTPGARFAYVTNTASASVTGLGIGFDGTLQLLDPTGITAASGAGPLDAALSNDGRFLYVLSFDTQAVNIFDVAEDGSLQHVADQTGLPDTANGLAAR